MLALPSPVEAGSYTVYTCRLPNGAAAPTDGWTSDGELPGLRQTDTCTNGGSLRTDMDANGFSDTFRRGWRWAAPPTTNLRELTMWRTYRLGLPNERATPFRDVLTGSRALEMDASAAPPLGTGNPSGGDQALGFSTTNRVQHVDLRDNVIQVRVGCTGFAGASCPSGGGMAAEQLIFAAHFRLEDLSDPAPGPATGALARGGTHQGIESVTFSASDQGSGVYRGIVEIDGLPFHTEILDANSGRCADATPGDSDPYQFAFRVPCKSSANGTMRFDTTEVSDGAHELRIRVEDAAGNGATVFGAEPIVVRNGPQAPAPPAPVSAATPGVPIPTPAIGPPLPSPVAPSRTITLTATPVGGKDGLVRTRYGRKVPIAGFIRDPEGKPMAGARIDVSSLLRVPRAKRRIESQITADPAGAFRYLAPAGPSRTIDFTYGSGPAAKASVDLRVRARLSLRLTRRKLRNGSAARYSGTLAGPNAGRKLVDVQVIVGRQWRPVCSARTTARGRYACRYRFKRTFRTTRYTFRARVRRQETLPYEPSQSGRRRLTVLP
ncbi:MAG: hypothetical protein H0T43_11705 [Solirubrobacterales bacterium]|nr:hypothetical protein [Solirubrobacterales bacterium]